MLKIKSIKKDGKYLIIIIKKPHLISLQTFIEKHNLLFSDNNNNFNWCLTEDKDIQLNFILRNYDDIKPYLLDILEGEENE